MSGSRPSSQRSASPIGRRIAAISSRTGASSVSRKSRTGAVTSSSQSRIGRTTCPIASITGRMRSPIHSLTGSSSPLNRAPRPSSGIRNVAAFVSAATRA